MAKPTYDQLLDVIARTAMPAAQPRPTCRREEGTDEATPNPARGDSFPSPPVTARFSRRENRPACQALTCETLAKVAGVPRRVEPHEERVHSR